MNRRHFIKQTGLAAAALWVPNFLKPMERFAVEGYKNLVIIQLSGGNDGLNTVIPFENDVYYNSRATLAIAKNEVLKLNEQLGFHPAMSGLHQLYKEGLLTIINSVGYPNPNRSHFRSMDIWQSASGTNEYLNNGWIGRYLDSSCAECNHPYLAIEADQTLSLALKGAIKKGFAVNNAKQLYNETREPFFEQLRNISNHHSNDNVAYLYKTMADTYSGAQYIFETSKTYTNTYEYPKNALGKQLKQIATFINSGMQTRVYYASMGGFDTHVGQLARQQKLLHDFSESTSAFVKNLQQSGTLDNTLVLVFSEFGRRVSQNASNGTDHGTASNLYVISSKLKTPGMYNAGPNLIDLDNGDLKYQIDFRAAYASLLQQWLGVSTSGIITSRHELLNLV
ncbi:MAG: DUF1501 domain-containing protein [Bacteroidetes bacterium]|nr:DUF1501 domain-containing protein [Bacteroidota bacterium]